MLSIYFIISWSQPPHQTLIGDKLALKTRGNWSPLSSSPLKKVVMQCNQSSNKLFVGLLSTARVSSALGSGGSGLVVHGTLGVGAKVLEGVLGLVLGLTGVAGDALLVGVGGGRAGLSSGLALGLGGLAALVGSRHFVWFVWLVGWTGRVVLATV